MQSANTITVSVTADTVISVIPLIYMGFTWRETAGATAVIRIWDSPTSDTTGDVLLDTISLAANESAREYYAEGIRAQKGIWVDVVSGSVEGGIRVIPTQARDILDNRSA